MRTSQRSNHVGLVLALVCGAQFMVVLDLVVVNVALPSIETDLGLNQSDLQWIVIAYGLTFGGFLLLGGRAADLFGRRAVLVAGLGVFTAASLGAGLAGSLAPLLVARGVEGLGAAMAAPAALSILTTTFAEGAARNRALGIFGGVAGSAASIGLIVSGVLTGGPGWRWIFLINVPIGIALVIAILVGIPKTAAPSQRGPIDLLGAITVTTGLLIVVYAINKSVDYGWSSPRTLGTLAGGVAILGLFAVIERNTASPLIPLSMFRLRTLTTANIVAVLVMGSFFGTAFQTTLFLQQVLGYSPLHTGLAGIITAVVSVVVASAIAARVVGRIGARWTLVSGQGIAATGLLYLARTPVNAAYWTDLAPAFLSFGVGIGLSGVAIQIVAFTGVTEQVSGLAGGMISTAQEFGAAVGLAIIATAAAAPSGDPGGLSTSNPALHAAALTEGFHRGALVAAGFSITAALAAALMLRPAKPVTDPPDVTKPTTEPMLSAA